MQTSLLPRPTQRLRRAPPGKQKSRSALPMKLVRAWAEVDDEGEGHLLPHPDHVAAAAHLERGEVAAARALVGHPALDHLGPHMCGPHFP